MPGQPHDARSAVLTLGIGMGAVVSFFWLRELDLSFLITWRALVLPVVLAAGLATGIASGLIVGEQARRNARVPRSGTYRLLNDMRALVLTGFAVLTVVAIVLPVLKVYGYWQAAALSPGDLRAVTWALLELWLAGAWSAYAITYGTILVSLLRRQRPATAASDVAL